MGSGRLSAWDTVMNTWNPQANELFLRAIEYASPDERRRFLDGACDGDAALRAEVEGLLAAGDQAGSFLELPANAAYLAATIERPIAEQPGTMIGHYKLLEQIGEGGFGVVFMAEQQEPVRRKVALKVLKPGMDTRQVVARFEAERQALALMDHPNIAHVFDGGVTDKGRPYFVMELVRGVPITEFCDQNCLAIRERLALFVDVCQAVQHAHQKGIIHRDIKPTNVMVTLHDGAPMVKVIDFGIAKAMGQQLTEKTLFTNFAQMVGTPLYMAPEQAAMSGLDTDTRGDVYSLGVLLYELLTGTTPFESERLKQVGYDEMRRIIRDEEPPKPSTRISTAATACQKRQGDPRGLRRLLRGELDWIVMKALEKDRERRYEGANELARDVKRYLCDEPVRAFPPSATYRLHKFVRRNKSLMVTASIAAMALFALALAGAFAYRSHRAEDRRLADQKKNEERLRGEQRHNALDRALVAAMSGDLDDAETAIGTAELLGASTGEVRMIRGLVTLHRGDAATAIVNLEQAVQLLPDNVAARAMLAAAYYHSGKTALLEQAWRELENMAPSTSEDYLFKGQVESLIRPAAAMRTLDEGVRRRNSIMARAVRAEARANRALVSGEIADAELALEDGSAARSMLPDNPYVLASNVFARLVAASIYDASGESVQSRRLLDSSDRDARQLKGFTASPIALKVSFWFFDYINDDDAALETSGHGTEFRHVCVRYRRGDYAGALVAAERAAGQGFGLARLERGFVLAELDNDISRALAAYQNAADVPDESRYFRVCQPLLLLFLGQKQKAIQAARQIRKEPDAVPFWHEYETGQRTQNWYCQYLDYLSDRMSEEDFLQAARASRTKRCEAHFVIALKHLCEGDRSGAREHFEKCVETRVFIFWDWIWARAFLKRVQQDPTWPRWIASDRAEATD